jgi:hypothetical protein
MEQGGGGVKQQAKAVKRTLNLGKRKGEQLRKQTLRSLEVLESTLRSGEERKTNSPFFSDDVSLPAYDERMLMSH